MLRSKSLNGRSISRPSWANFGFFACPVPTIFELDHADVFEYREVPMDLFVVAVYQICGFPDTLGFVFEDHL